MKIKYKVTSEKEAVAILVVLAALFIGYILNIVKIALVGFGPNANEHIAELIVRGLGVIVFPIGAIFGFF